MRSKPIGKDTVLCISLAGKPSNFGATLFGLLFEKMGMDWAYKPIQVDLMGLPGAVAAIRALHIRGCGVSMPHKIQVIRYLDCVVPAAKKIGAVNTIVNNNGILIGHNTDYLGFARAVGEKCGLNGKSAVVLGNGGAARAAVLALKKLGTKKIFVCARNKRKAKKLCAEFKCAYLPRNGIRNCGAYLFFNATPVGMFSNVSKMPITKNELASFKAVADVVNNPVETSLIRTARRTGKTTIPGYKMSLYQGLAQFELYTGRKPSLAGIERNVVAALRKR